MDKQNYGLNYIDKGAQRSQEILCKLRSELSQLEHDKNDRIIAICGSYGRKEALEHSDLDYFVIGDGTEDKDISRHMKALLRKLELSSPSPGGVFEEWSKRGDLLENIGGEEDSNRNITRRILLLLEGDSLLGEEAFKELRRELLERYVKAEIPDHHLTLFLLNDIIRYWRTVCVDYEHKIGQGKDWAPRNIKLVFSRKLLYASGLFCVALTADLSRDKKIDELEEMFSLSVIDRMIKVCGRRAMQPVLTGYDRFLACMASEESREALERLEDTRESRRDNPVFREVKNEGYRFTRDLLKLFESTFHSTHPIRRAIIY